MVESLVDLREWRLTPGLRSPGLRCAASARVEFFFGVHRGADFPLSIKISVVVRCFLPKEEEAGTSSAIAAVSRMLTASSRAMRPVAGGAVSLSRRAGAFAMGQRRAYQGNLQDKDRIFTNLCAPPTASAACWQAALNTCARFTGTMTRTGASRAR